MLGLSELGLDGMNSIGGEGRYGMPRRGKCVAPCNSREGRKIRIETDCLVPNHCFKGNVFCVI